MSAAVPQPAAEMRRVESIVTREAVLDADTGGELIYAIGDIHGCYDLMVELLAFAVEDALGRAGPRLPVFVLCGDYIDRGPDSAKVIEALTLIQRRTDIDLHLLKGNHEQALLAFLDQPREGAMWLQCGGAETLRSYGVEPPEPDGPPEAMDRARDQLLGRMPASHLLLFQRLKLMVTAGDYAFVHAGIRPKVSLARQTENDLLWMRRGFVDAPGPFEKVIVHGHTWTRDQPELHPHRIGVDTGAYATGALTAVRLDMGEMGVLQARRAPEDQKPSVVPEVAAPVGSATGPAHHADHPGPGEQPQQIAARQRDGHDERPQQGITQEDDRAGADHGEDNSPNVPGAHVGGSR